MDQLPEPDVVPASEENSALSAIMDAIGTYFGNMPVVIQKNVAKAFGHMMKVPNAYIDGWASEVKATSDARVLVTKATGKALAKSVEVDRSLAAIATATHARKILRQQVNAAKVLQQAAEEIQKLPAPAEQEIEEISDDWLNAFEREAVDMSSEHMQKLFGKILAGEICRPESYSIRTVKLMAQLDHRPAVLFQKLCSLTSTIQIGPSIIDSRVISVAGPANSNGLQKFGLGFADLNILFEYGLIISDYNSNINYTGITLDINNPNGSPVSLPFTYQNRWHMLAPKSAITEQHPDAKVSGVGLSSAGMELLRIVDIEEDLTYTKALTEYFDRLGFTLTVIK
jgi:hypothetical protein